MKKHIVLLLILLIIGGRRSVVAQQPTSQPGTVKYFPKAQRIRHDGSCVTIGKQEKNVLVFGLRQTANGALLKAI
jgi:hypothetical protein